MKPTLKDLVDLMDETGATVLYVGDNKYLFYPFWLQVEDDGMTVTQYHLDHLPQELRDAIKEDRQQ